MTDPFQIGDVIVRESGSESYRYIVIGWTPYGKLRLIRGREGTELTTWWSSPANLPRSYRLERAA